MLFREQALSPNQFGDAMVVLSIFGYRLLSHLEVTARRQRPQEGVACVCLKRYRPAQPTERWALFAD